jgi:hypothetical protein
VHLTHTEFFNLGDTIQCCLIIAGLDDVIRIHASCEQQIRAHQKNISLPQFGSDFRRLLINRFEGCLFSLYASIEYGSIHRRR